LTKSLCVISHFLSLYSRSLPLDRSRSFSLFNFQGPISLCRSLQKRDLLILSRLLRFVNTFFIFFCYLLPPYFFALFFSSLSLAADFHSTTSPLLLSIYFWKKIKKKFIFKILFRYLYFLIINLCFLIYFLLYLYYVLNIFYYKTENKLAVKSASYNIFYII